ncbi:MAG: hypothetical protein MHMPM18_002402 [Marteilia pararefringens]
MVSGQSAAAAGGIGLSEGSRGQKVVTYWNDPPQFLEPLDESQGDTLPAVNSDLLRKVVDYCAQNDSRVRILLLDQLASLFNKMDTKSEDSQKDLLNDRESKLLSLIFANIKNNHTASLRYFYILNNECNSGSYKWLMALRFLIDEFHNIKQ